MEERQTLDLNVTGSTPVSPATPIQTEHFVFVPYSKELAKEWERLKWLKIPLK